MTNTLAAGSIGKCINFVKETMKKFLLLFSLIFSLFLTTAYADKPVFAFVYVGPGDGGWTYAHDLRRESEKESFRNNLQSNPFLRLIHKEFFVI